MNDEMRTAFVKWAKAYAATRKFSDHEFDLVEDSFEAGFEAANKASVPERPMALAGAKE